MTIQLNMVATMLLQLMQKHDPNKGQAISYSLVSVTWNPSWNWIYGTHIALFLFFKREIIGLITVSLRDLSSSHHWTFSVLAMGMGFWMGILVTAEWW